MTSIGLIADTHSHLDESVFTHFRDCDEIWHAGDFGNMALAERLAAFKPLRGVYGNIDGYDIRSVYPETLQWTCEDVRVLMTHIGGYPGRYVPKVKDLMKASPPSLFISGHSHILKIIYDSTYQCLHMNPGAAGKEGWHKTKTVIRFSINGKEITRCEVIELGSRSS